MKDSITSRVRRLEPPKSVPRDVKTLAKLAGEKKKLSLSDLSLAAFNISVNANL